MKYTEDGGKTDDSTKDSIDTIMGMVEAMKAKIRGKTADAGHSQGEAGGPPPMPGGEDDESVFDFIQNYIGSQLAGGGDDDDGDAATTTDNDDSPLDNEDDEGSEETVQTLKYHAGRKTEL